MRRPNEQLSQREFTYAMRFMLDEGFDWQAVELAASHPRAMRSAHVTHNLGRARVARLRHLVANHARSFVDA